MKLPWLLALAALLAHTATAQKWSQPADDEGSTRDDFYDDEDLYSGSGSGSSDIGVKPTTSGVTFTTEEPILFSTTQATSPAPSASPAAEPSPSPEDVVSTVFPTEADGESGIYMEIEREREKDRELERERQMEREREREQIREIERQREREREQEREKERERERERQRERELERQRELERIRAAQTTAAPRSPAVFPVSTTGLTTSAVESAGPSAGSDDPLSPDEGEEDVYLSPEPTSVDPGSDVETTADYDYDASTTAETTPEPTTAAPTTTPATTTKTRIPFRPRVPASRTTQGVPTERTTRPQPPAATQEGSNEVGAAGPTGDSEIGKDRRNNLGLMPDFSGNTVDSGSSAAQLPQKNILERKEVLIAVIVGGVVGALFAAFLVMLLVYRMKKKDEGSYTLEEPKQATVTYQKPDKQEEFYA
ncbi:syndecan-3 [Poeciliopsis prolifica]|uniref:syndecan-3 n=1 Tax=Poeciliopsis prolifica TaxID=188132 RepID=UPI0024139871|nr:syndecan-3 [Poeciliopsis prolifica]